MTPSLLSLTLHTIQVLCQPRLLYLLLGSLVSQSLLLSHQGLVGRKGGNQLCEGLEGQACDLSCRLPVMSLTWDSTEVREEIESSSFAWASLSVASITCDMTT